MTSHAVAIRTSLEPRPAPASGSRAETVRRALREDLALRNDFWRGEVTLHAVESRPRAVRTDREHARNPHYQLGLLLAPAFIAFSRHVLEHASEYDRVYFLSREGWMFMRMYHKLAKALGVRAAKPDGAYLAVNRRLTFLASMDGLTLDEIRRMWRQYPGQTLRQLLRNLTLPEDPFLHLAARHGLTDPDKRIRRPGQHKAFQGFMHDPHVQRMFELHRDDLRSLLNGYLRQRGFFMGGRVALVDIGWKGSIQTNLHRAARNVEGCPEIHGVYFGLDHAPAMDEDASTRHGFFCDSRTEDLLQKCILRNNSVFEMFASGPHGSVAAYERDARGWVHARVKVEKEESGNFRGRFREVWRGIDHYLSDYLDTPEALATPAAELRPVLLDRLRRYILYPTRREARAFLDYSHVENFGVYTVSRYHFHGSRRTLLARPWRGIPSRLLQSLRQQRWSEGVCARSGVPLANFVFDFLNTRRNSR